MNLIQFVLLLFNSHFSLILLYKTIIISPETSRFEKNDWFVGKVVSQIEIVM
jgi:hypothetical protein